MNGKVILEILKDPEMSDEEKIQECQLMGFYLEEIFEELIKELKL